MTALDTLDRPGAPPRRPAAALRLAGVVHRSFPERRDPLWGWPDEIAAALQREYGTRIALAQLRERTGNGFIPMCEAVLDQARPDAVDAVLLAYHSPDLFHSPVAGFYLAEHLDGAPVPSSVAEPGPGAPFTALRVAAGMVGLGTAGRGLLFVLDQNAAGPGLQPWPGTGADAAVLIRFGDQGDVEVEETVRTTVAAGPAAAHLLAALAGRHAGTRVVLGAGLAAVATDPALAGLDLVAAPATAGCTGVWAALAERWPLTGPVLLADHGGSRLDACLLVPGVAR